MTAVLYHAVIVLRSGFGEREKEIKGLNLNGRIGLKEDGKFRVGPIVVPCTLLGKDRVQYRQELLLCHRKKVEVIVAFDLGDLAICAAQRQAEQRRKQIFFIASIFCDQGESKRFASGVRTRNFHLLSATRFPPHSPLGQMCQHRNLLKPDSVFYNLHNPYDLIVPGFACGIFQHQTIPTLRNRQFVRGILASYRITLILELIADSHLETVTPQRPGLRFMHIRSDIFVFRWPTTQYRQ